MPKIRKITIGKRMTVNLGDFNNVQPLIELTADIEEGEDYHEVREGLMDLVDAHLSEEIGKHDED